MLRFCDGCSKLFFKKSQRILDIKVTDNDGILEVEIGQVFCGECSDKSKDLIKEALKKVKNQK